MNNGSDQVNHGLQNLKKLGWQRFNFINEMLDNLRGRATRAENSPRAFENNWLKMPGISLAVTQIGARVCIVELCCDQKNSRLWGMGLMPGIELKVISKTADGSVVIALQDQRLGLGADLAHQIRVIPADNLQETTYQLFTKEKRSMKPDSNIPTAKLRHCSVGSIVRVVSYEPTARAYKRKLLAMGLTPGTQLTITRHAPLGDPTEIEVRGFQLSLRKSEADALLIELI